MPCRVVPIGVVFCLLLLGGCSPSVSGNRQRHEGPKVNLSDFIRNTAAYKGKTITLGLRIDEPIASNSGQSLRDFVGRYVKFSATGPKGERLSLVVKIPANLTVPEVGSSDEVRVTFICTRGDLRQGNEARSIEKP
jgi:hypothetical protein